MGLTLTDHPPYIVALMTSGTILIFITSPPMKYSARSPVPGIFVRRQPAVYRGERLGIGS
jgi:hypothetical protein